MSKKPYSSTSVPLSELFLASRDGNFAAANDIVTKFFQTQNTPSPRRGFFSKKSSKPADPSPQRARELLEFDGYYILDSGKKVRHVTPLLVAARFGHSAIVDLLLRHGANPNHQNSGKVTPLFVAAQYCHAQAVGSLLAAGASIDCQTVTGTTPLSKACEAGSAPIAALLLQRGADARAARNDGTTCLFHACAANDAATAQLLLEAGADSNAMSPLVVAAAHGNLALIELLVSKGASLESQLIQRYIFIFILFFHFFFLILFTIIN